MRSKLELNKIILGDCVEVMKEMPDESADVIFADPPYFGGQKKKVIPRYDGYSGNRFDTGKAKWAYPKSLEYQFSFTRAWLQECLGCGRRRAHLWRPVV